MFQTEPAGRPQGIQVSHKLLQSVTLMSRHPSRRRAVKQPSLAPEQNVNSTRIESQTLEASAVTLQHSVFARCCFDPPSPPPTHTPGLGALGGGGGGRGGGEYARAGFPRKFPVGSRAPRATPVERSEAAPSSAAGPSYGECTMGPGMGVWRDCVWGARA